MKLSGFGTRAMSLREAAAVIFVLVALLPLLLLVSVISASGLIAKPEAQLAVFMALVIAGLGLIVFWKLIEQISRLVVRERLPAAHAALGSGDAPMRIPAIGHV